MKYLIYSYVFQTNTLCHNYSSSLCEYDSDTIYLRRQCYHWWLKRLWYTKCKYSHNRLASDWFRDYSCPSLRTERYALYDHDNGSYFYWIANRLKPLLLW